MIRDVVIVSLYYLCGLSSKGHNSSLRTLGVGSLVWLWPCNTVSNNWSWIPTTPPQSIRIMSQRPVWCSWYHMVYHTWIGSLSHDHHVARSAVWHANPWCTCSPDPCSLGRLDGNSFWSLSFGSWKGSCSTTHSGLQRPTSLYLVGTLQSTVNSLFRITKLPCTLYIVFTQHFCAMPVVLVAINLCHYGLESNIIRVA